MVLHSKENNSTGRDSWHATSGSLLRRKRVGRSRIDIGGYFQESYAYRVSSNFPENWLTNIEEQPKLSGVAPVGREIGGVMRCGYRFMKIRFEEEKSVYQVDWKDIVSILESPVVKEIRVNEKRSYVMI